MHAAAKALIVMQQADAKSSSKYKWTYIQGRPYPPKANDPQFPLPHQKYLFSLSLPFFSLTFRSLSLPSPFHSRFSVSIPQIQLGYWGELWAPPSTQTQIDASGSQNAPRGSQHLSACRTFPTTQKAPFPHRFRRPCLRINMNVPWYVTMFLQRDALCKALYCDCMLSNRPSVRLSVTLVDQDHIGLHVSRKNSRKFPTV